MLIILLEYNINFRLAYYAGIIGTVDTLSYSCSTLKTVYLGNQEWSNRNVEKQKACSLYMCECYKDFWCNVSGVNLFSLKIRLVLLAYYNNIGYVCASICYASLVYI